MTRRYRMNNDYIKIKRINGADLDPNDEWALLKQWGKEALDELAEEEAAQIEIGKSHGKE